MIDGYKEMYVLGNQFLFFTWGVCKLYIKRRL